MSAGHTPDAEKRHEEDLFNEWLNEIAPSNRDIGRESAWLGWQAGRAALRVQLTPGLYGTGNMLGRMS